MKKTIAIITMIVGFAASHLSFTKIATVTAIGYASNSYSQSGVNAYRAGNYYYLFVQGGGLDPLTGAPIISQTSKDTTWQHGKVFIYDSLVVHATPATSDSKMLSLEPNGKLACTSFSNINLPYSQITGTPTIPASTTYTSGTGISLTGSVIANTLPHINTTITVGSGISSAASANAYTLTNNAPDQVVSITAVGGNTISGSYPNFTITRKRQETYSGTTNASGAVTVTFATAYSVAPNIQANIINGADNQNIRITSISTTGFTVLVRTRVDVIGLLPTWNNASGLGVDILITEK